MGVLKLFANLIFICFLVIFNNILVTSAKSEGDSCTDQYTNTLGSCTRADRCQSAKHDYQTNGIKPTFCEFSADRPLVCCRDTSTILQTAAPLGADSRPVWGTDDRSIRVSERKCIEYSKQVVETVDFVPLLPNPETMSISSAKCNYAGVELIVGGENAALGEFPHMAAIGWATPEGSYTFDCGGSLISTNYVLTAAHCTWSSHVSDHEPVIVRLGEQNLDPNVRDNANPVDVPIKRIIKHPDYKPPLKYNDIALLELASDVTPENNIRPGCLWSKSESPRSQAIATGWGVLDSVTQRRSNDLQKVSLSLFSNSECDRTLSDYRSKYWGGFRDSQLCAGELRGGKDTCQGDSGSPLQVASKENHCIYHLIGITSFGFKKCAQAGQPAIYTRISSYLDWIEGNVWPGQ